MLERLTPEQRVAFVLHDVFAVPFDGVAGALGVSAEAARQHASRARKAVHDRAPRRAAPLGEQRAVLDAFLAAARLGDLQGLIALLDPEAVLTSDGGGLVQAARRPISGAEKVARAFIGFIAKVRPAEWFAEPALVNGEFGVVGWLRQPGGDELALAGVISIDMTPGGLVEQISMVMNPEKLTRLGGITPSTPPEPL